MLKRYGCMIIVLAVVVAIITSVGIMTWRWYNSGIADLEQAYERLVQAEEDSADLYETSIKDGYKVVYDGIDLTQEPYGSLATRFTFYYVDEKKLILLIPRGYGRR